jgi:hypothetical protein
LADFALCSVVTDRFVAGYIAMIHTFRQTNPDLDPSLYVIAEAGEGFLSSAKRALIEDTCGPVTFLEPDPDVYAPVYERAHRQFGTPPRLMAAFYVFEAFYRPKERFVLCLDSDILVTGSFRDILSCRARFAAVRARSPHNGAPEEYVNTGVMWLDLERLGKLGHPERLMEQVGSLKPVRGTGLADQAIINMVWPNQTMFYLPLNFNFTKRSLMFELTSRDPEAAEAFSAYERVGTPKRMRALIAELDVRALHFVGEKPWDMKTSAREAAYGAIDELWWDSLHEIGNESVTALALDTYVRRPVS